MSPINLTAEAYTIPFQWHELHARVFRPAAPAIGRIFYLHGGGLVFGEPDDLPLCYVNLFLAMLRGTGVIFKVIYAPAT